jgi:hypothetical protein
MTEPMTETTCPAAAEADELRAALVLMKAERDALMEMMVRQTCEARPWGSERWQSYDSRESALAAVRAAAGPDGGGGCHAE